ncbi:hypothetical protein [Saccharopolyspora griseoalba]|uniref:Uncharacterized protein n=1 Tax=Saccharopolyspora griseoalba TaxID=1431848 RepID=A0ABW2LRN4_9PSEU
MSQQPSPQEVAEQVLAHPSVARLHGGRFGEIASYLPGDKVVGVRLPEDAPAEIGVALRMDRPLQETAEELRAQLSEQLGRPVDVVVSDVVTDDESHESDRVE